MENQIAELDVHNSKIAFAKLYTTKTPIISADLLNDRVLPFFEEYELPMLRVLTDRGTEYCRKAATHDYQLYLAINDIDHTKTKGQIPSDQRDLRAFPQNSFTRALSHHVQKKDI